MVTRAVSGQILTVSESEAKMPRAIFFAHSSMLAIVVHLASKAETSIFLYPSLPSSQAASEGPRATEQFAAIAAAFVSSLAASCQSQEVGATFLAELADRQHEAYLRKDRSASYDLKFGD